LLLDGAPDDDAIDGDDDVEASWGMLTLPIGLPDDPTSPPCQLVVLVGAAEMDDAVEGVNVIACCVGSGTDDEVSRFEPVSSIGLADATEDQELP